MNREFVLVEINREIDFVLTLIQRKVSQGEGLNQEMDELFQIVERLERLRSRFLERC